MVLMLDDKGQGIMLAPDPELIRKIETLPPNALRDLDHFIRHAVRPRHLWRRNNSIGFRLLLAQRRQQ